MNEIKLSGILQAVVEHNSEGKTFITASLEFVEGQSILVLAVGETRVRQLGPFDSGDHVRITGRLVVFRDGFAVLLDSCVPWATASQKRDSIPRSFGGDLDLREAYIGDAAKGQKRSWRR